MKLQEKFELELKKHTDEAASKVAAVLQRAEEQGRMIESLHTSVSILMLLIFFYTDQDYSLSSIYRHDVITF